MTVHIESKQAKATVEKLKKGMPPQVDEEVLGEVVSQEPMANVGVSASRTFNLGNYESLKTTVSVHMPCKPTLEDINDTYIFCDQWVSDKMSEIQDEVHQSLSS